MQSTGTLNMGKSVSAVSAGMPRDAIIIYVLCGDCVSPVCDFEICASQMKI